MAELLTAFVDAGLRLVSVAEATDEEHPMRIGVLAAGEPSPGTAARRIRPIVIGVDLRDDRILAVEGYDPIKGERFCRPPGRRAGVRGDDPDGLLSLLGTTAEPAAPDDPPQ